MIPKRSNLLFVAVCLFLLIIVQQFAFASESTNDCHCFRNRTFNPLDRFASDDYLLTTTFNSLLSIEFDISKRQIIMMKMSEGVANNDLITALYISKTSGVEIVQILKMKKKMSWKDIVSSIPVNTTNQETNTLFNFINSGATDIQIAEHITNIMIADRFSPSPETIDSLKKRNLTYHKIILALTLAHRTSVPAVVIADQHLKNNLSWSEIAYNFGLQPSDVGKIFENNKSGNKKELP